MKKVAVVIPYYHNDLSVTEQISLAQCRLILGKYDIVLVAPESLEVEDDKSFMVKRVPDKWLLNIDNYNQLMVQKFFYKMFLDYEYILLYQLDAYVFKDELLQFCDMGYDYIGAPWLRGNRFYHGEKALVFVGNGGFSLRKVESFCRLALEDTLINIPEDVFWSEHISDDFLVPDMDVALRFAFEEQVQKCYELNNRQLPFGIHAWMNFDFEFIREFILGYDEQISLVEDKKLDLKRDYGYNKHLFYSNEQLEKRKFGKIQNEFDRLVVFGAGNLGRDCIWLLKRAGYSYISCVDNNKIGENIDDITIESPDILSDIGDSTGIIIAVKKETASQIMVQLKEMCIKTENIYLFEDLFEEE